MTDLFAHCAGVVPLRPRIAPWMTSFLETTTPGELLATYGSPLNVQSTAPFIDNMTALADCGRARGVSLTPFFARKANKCLSYVAAARDAGYGIDAASLAEVAQALELGVPGARIICTAGVKPDVLIELCVARDVTVIVDNDEELHQLALAARTQGTVCRIGLRVAGFEHGAKILHSRFGYDLAALDTVIARVQTAYADTLDLAGLQFHLGGYDPSQRASAIMGLLPAMSRLVAARNTLPDTAHADTFLDIGGGIPMRYLEDTADWTAYLSAHGEALSGHRDPITYNNDALGRRQSHHEGDHENTSGWSAPDAYPTAHELVQADWMAAVLDTHHAGQPLHAHLAELGVTLRCEPGRSVLDGCGLTLARVVHVKNDTAGRVVAGVEMNRTQFRTGFAEVMFDPLLLPADRPPAAPTEAHLTGTYCTESEFIFKRRFVFANGLARGDTLVLPNSAGYLVHFLESRSHQFELAANVFVDTTHGLQRDAIDG